MRFTVFNTKIHVSFLFMSIICIFLLIDKTGLFLPMFLASLLHETGHLLSMRLFDNHPSEINLIPGSIQIVNRMGINNLSVFEYLSGPFVNLLLFVIIFVNGFVFSNKTYFVFGFINLLLGVFNLLPFKGLDGGSVLLIYLSNKYSAQKGEKVLNIISIVVGISLLLLGLFLTVSYKTNLNAYILGLYLILSVLLKF